MKPIKQVLKSKRGKILIMVFLVIALFGDKMTFLEGKKEAGPSMEECRSYGADYIACLVAGCVFADPGIGNYCTSCIKTGGKTYLTLGAFNEFDLIENYPEIYPEETCCEDYRMIEQDIREDYIICVKEGTGVGTCTGTQKQIADVFKFLGKDMNCQTRFFAGLGILFMAMMLMMTAI